VFLAPALAFGDIGQIIYHSPNYPPLCLDLDTPYLPTSAVNLTPCIPLSATQYWHLDLLKLQITSYPWGHTCLTITHPDDPASSLFSQQPVLAKSCEYVQSGRGSAQGQTDGFQKLEWMNGTLIWRGQSKVLPQALNLRYCIEVRGSPDAMTVLSLEHCAKDKSEQGFEFQATQPLEFELDHDDIDSGSDQEYED